MNRPAADLCVRTRSTYRTAQDGRRPADERERTHPIPWDPMGRYRIAPVLSIGRLKLVHEIEWRPSDRSGSNTRLLMRSREMS